MNTEPKTKNPEFTKLTCIYSGETTYISKNRIDHDELLTRITKEWDNRRKES